MLRFVSIKPVKDGLVVRSRVAPLVLTFNSSFGGLKVSLCFSSGKFGDVPSVLEFPVRSSQVSQRKPAALLLPPSLPMRRDHEMLNIATVAAYVHLFVDGRFLSAIFADDTEHAGLSHCCIQNVCFERTRSITPSRAVSTSAAVWKRSFGCVVMVLSNISYTKCTLGFAFGSRRSSSPSPYSSRKRVFPLIMK